MNKACFVVKGLLLLCFAALLLSTSAAAPDARLAVGAKAPDFTLKDLDGKTHKLSDYTKAGKIVVLEFWSPECPVVTKYYVKPKGKDQGAMPATYAQVKGKDLVWLAVDSLPESTEGNSREDMTRMSKAHGVAWPLLLDGKQEVASAYGAQTTPDIFIIDAKGKLAYSGAVDQGTFKEIPKGTNYVVEAVKALRAGKTPASQSTQPFGCSIW